MASNHVGGFGKPTDEPLHFYWDDAKQTTETLTCTATVTPPAGQGDPITVTATKQVVVVRPAVTNWGIKGGVVTASSRQFGFYGYYGTPGDAVYKGGQSWHDITLTVPPPFSGGTLSFGQLITPDRKVYRQLPAGSTASAYYQLPNNATKGLDSGFPYATAGAVPTPTNKELGGDSPTINPLDTPTANDGGGNNWNKWQASDSFVTYLMYTPPGSNSTYVPLQQYMWSWSETLTLDSPQPGWNLTSSTPASPSPPQDTTTFPEWTLVHSGTSGAAFVPPPSP